MEPSRKTERRGEEKKDRGGGKRMYGKKGEREERDRDGEITGVHGVLTG